MKLQAALFMTAWCLIISLQFTNARTVPQVPHGLEDGLVHGLEDGLVHGLEDGVNSEAQKMLQDFQLGFKDEQVKGNDYAEVDPKPRVLRSPKGCDRGWTSIGDRCYIISTDLEESNRDWHAAMKYCTILGGDLATFGHQTANNKDPLLDYLYKHMKAKDLNQLWLGASKSGSSWKMVDGRTLDIDSTMWKTNNPSGDGNCVNILAAGLRRAYINDENCSRKRAFVCEK